MPNWHPPVLVDWPVKTLGSWPTLRKCHCRVATPSESVASLNRLRTASRECESTMPQQPPQDDAVLVMRGGARRRTSGN
jgi:hypothetical protein